VKKRSHVKSLLQGLVRKFDGDFCKAVLIWIMTMILRYGISALVLVCFVGQALAQGPNQVRSPFKVGEVPQYKVKWTFIRLGTVVIRQLQSGSADTTSYLLELSVQSAPALPFLDVHFTNQSLLSVISQSIVRETIISGKDPSEKTIYSYEPSNLQIIMEDSAGGRLIRKDSLKAETACYDALGLLMLSRQLIGPVAHAPDAQRIPDRPN